MDFFSSDSSIRLSFFNSIFELLAGYNIAYAGLHIVNHYINSHLIKTAFLHHKYAKKIHDEALLNIVNFKNLLASAHNAKIDSYLNELNRLVKKYDRYHYNTRYLKFKAKVKFIPVFVYSGFYCFYVLLLAGFSETQRTIAIAQNLFDIQVNGVFYVRNCSFSILMIFNLFSTYKLGDILLRNWKKRGSDKKIVLVATRLLFFSITTYFCISVCITFIVNVIFNYSFGNSLLFSLSVLIWSFFIGLFPILALTFWIFGANRVKFSIQQDVVDAIAYEIRLLQVSPFSSNKFSKAEGHQKYLNSINNFSATRWLNIVRFFSLNKYRLMTTSIMMSIIFLSLYYILIPQEERIVEIVKNASTYEYNSYKALPRIDTSWFDKFFTRKSSVRTEIYENMSFHKENGEIIFGFKDPSLKFEFIDGKIISMNDERVIIETNKYWSGKWFNAKQKVFSTQSVMPIKETQIYILKREQGRWLIDKISSIQKVQYL